MRAAYPNYSLSPTARETWTCPFSKLLGPAVRITRGTIRPFRRHIFMTNTTAAAGGAPAPMNVFARFVGIITSPKDTFRSVVAAPKWLGMLALCTVLVLGLVGGFLFTKVGQDAWLTQTIESSAAFGRPMNDQQVQTMEK